MSAEHYRIAGLQLSLDLANDTTFAPAWRGFGPYMQRQLPARCAADIRIAGYAGALPACSEATRLERGPGFWSAYALGERTLFTCQGKDEHRGVWRAIVSDAHAQHFEVITRADASFLARGAPLPHPLAFPSAELIVLSHIAARDGAVLHACGVRDHEDLGAGYLFCGRSGAGKSTTARLWQGHGDVLNDDRVLVRRATGSSAFRVHGTPWHGDFTLTNPGSAPLRAVFFLEHAASHQLVELSPAEAERQLLTSVWLPLWDRHDGLAKTLELCRDLVRSVPCFRLRFRRDSDVIQLVRSAADSCSQEPLAVPA
jgi:hypothetical protein